MGRGLIVVHGCAFTGGSSVLQSVYEQEAPKEWQECKAYGVPIRWPTLLTVTITPFVYIAPPPIPTRPSVTPKEVLALIREKEVRAVDLRFMDFPGLWQHFTIPAEELDEQTFEEGKGFNGSSIRGWQAINESDMLVKPVPETAFIDPFCKDKTLTILCNIHDPLTGEEYTRDPRTWPARPSIT